MVIWLIGLSASGKTTIGKKIHSLLRLDGGPTVFLDGDLIRDSFGQNLGFTLEERRRSAERVSGICRLLDAQGIDVVCAVLSIFEETHIWNREHLSEYREIYIEVSPETVVRREFKGLYDRALEGRELNVVGVDIPFEAPRIPDLVVNNDEDYLNIDLLAHRIIEELGISMGSEYRYTRRRLLYEKEQYEYSEYVGDYFLNAYMAERRHMLRSLGKRMATLSPISMPKESGTAWIRSLGVHEDANPYVQLELPVPDNSMERTSEAQVATDVFLVNALTQAAEGQRAHVVGSITPLVRRFEVSKRLYSAYDPAFKCQLDHSDCDRLLRYVMLGVLLGHLYPYAGRHRQIVFLNALLKLGDIVASECIYGATPATVFLGHRMIEMELKIVHSESVGTDL